MYNNVTKESATHASSDREAYLDRLGNWFGWRLAETKEIAAVKLLPNN